MIVPNLATLKLAAKSAMLWIVLGLMATTNSCSYMVGKANQKAAYSAQEAKAANKAAKEIKAEAEKRTPMVVKKEGKTVAAAARINKAKEDIYYATELRPISPSCDLSDAEYNGYGVLADEINAAATSGSVQ